MTTDETVDCYNCGRSNPEWAQVCRSCGVQLRHGQARVVPTGRIPTDTNSLISIAAVIGVILGAVVLGIFLSSLNPTDPIVGEGAPTPTATPSPTAEATNRAAERHARADARPPLRRFRARSPSEASSMRIAKSRLRSRRSRRRWRSRTRCRCRAASGRSTIENEIAKIDDDGGETIVLPRESVGVDPAATSVRLRGRHRRRFLRRMGAR